MSTIEVQIDVPNPEGLDLPERLRWIPVTVWDVETGMAIWDESDESGSARFDVPPGDYRVEVGGANSPYHAKEIGRVEGTDGPTKEPIVLRCDLPAPRVCSLEISGLDDEERVSIQTAAGYYTRYDLEGPDIRLPHFLLPSGRWSASTYSERKDGTWRRVDLEVPRDIGQQLVLQLPE